VRSFSSDELAEMSFSMFSRVQPAATLMRSLPLSAEAMPSALRVDSTAEGSTPRMMMSEAVMAFAFSPREMRSLPDLVCSENCEDSRCSETSVWTQAMYFENCAFESVVELIRLFNMGVPRLPSICQINGRLPEVINLPQPRMQSVCPDMAVGEYGVRVLGGLHTASDGLKLLNEIVQLHFIEEVFEDEPQPCRCRS